MLNAQILALALMPLLSGVSPGVGPTPVDLPTLLGLGRPLSREFLVGTWKHSDHFVRWGVTDKQRARIRRFHGDAFMYLREDGTMKMINLFRPAEGRWEVMDGAIKLYDPAHPQWGTRILPVRKRDDKRIWVLLPYAGGANGIGMERVSDTESVSSARKRPKSDRQRTSTTPRATGEAPESRGLMPLPGEHVNIEWKLPQYEVR